MPTEFKALSEQIIAKLMTPTTLARVRTVQPNRAMLTPSLFPTRSVDRLDYSYWLSQHVDIVPQTTIISFNAEAPVINRPGDAKMWGNLAKIAAKMPVLEDDGVRYFYGSEAERGSLMELFTNDQIRLAQSIRERQETLGIEAVSTGIINIKEGEIEQRVDFGVPNGQKAMLTGSDMWDDPTSNPIGDIQAWVNDVMIAGGRVEPTRILTTKKVLNNILKTDIVRRMIHGDTGTAMPVTQGNLTALLSSMGLPSEIITYDRRSSSILPDGKTVSYRPFREGTVVLLPPGSLGDMLEGPTFEAVTSDMAEIGGVSRSGLWFDAWADFDPKRIWQKVVVTTFPTFPMAQQIFIARVMQDQA